MTTNSFDWDEELAPETEEEVYRALLRALRRKQGFGLFFVQCTKAQGETIVADLRRDLSQQKIEELHLQGEVVTLYDQIAEIWNEQRFDVLVIDGLETSLYAYEDTKRFSGWSSEDIYNYSWKGVPQILNHLNQQREHLRNDFPVRLVFLVPSFVVDYFIQRAADFLDWRSGLFRFPPDPRIIVQDAERFFMNGGFIAYQTLTSQERVERILHLKSLQERCSDVESKARLLFELGLLFGAEQDYGDAIISWEKLLEYRSDKPEAWFNLGSALSTLGREEEAITSYDKGLEFKPDDYRAWYNRGVALSTLGRKEEAITSYDKGLEFKPDDYRAWGNRGIALSDLGRNEEAIESFDHALKHKPDDYRAWGIRGIALAALGHYEEALISYNRVLEIKPSDNYAIYKKAACYSLQEDIQKTIEILQHAIILYPKYQEMAKTDADFDLIRQDDQFKALIGE